MSISFFVDGTPIEKGSTRAFVIGGRAVTTAANKKTKPWEVTVRSAAKEAFSRFGVSTDPFYISVDFFMPRPKTVSENKRPHPTVKPDLDKLLRCILDALTGVVYVDDSQVISVSANKRYPSPGDVVGALVSISSF